MKVSKKFRGAKFAFLLVMLFAISIAFVGCGDNPPVVVIEGEIPEGVLGGGGSSGQETPKEWTVTFDLDGGTISDGSTSQSTYTRNVGNGYTVGKPYDDPTKEGSDTEDWTFAGWYADKGYTQEFDFDNTRITSDITIYAKWNKRDVSRISIRNIDSFEFKSDTTYLIDKTITEATQISSIGTKLKTAGESGIINVKLDFSNCGENLTSIPDNAFKDCNALSDLVLPTNYDTKLNQIGESAFEGCENLVSINTDKISAIGKSAFSGCKKLASFKPAISLHIIEEQAFKGCESLSINYDEYNKDAIETIKAEAFSGCKNIENFKARNLKTIGERAFEGCENLVSIDNPDNVETIGKNAFSGCKKLETISFSYKFDTIETETFKGCTSLKSVSLPNNTLISIKENAFEGCTALSEIDLTQVKSLLKEAFKGCSSLERIYSLKNLTDTSLAEGVFSGCEKLTNSKLLETVQLYEIDLSKSILKIEKNAFENCKALTIFDLNNVTQVDSGAFKGCDAISTIITNTDAIESVASELKSTLKEVIIKSGTSIAANAFIDCTKLEKVTIPQTVTSIGANAFKNCSSFKEIDASKMTVGDGAFLGCTGLETVTAKRGDVAKITQDAKSSLKTLSVTYPEGVATSPIADGEFENYTALENISISATKIGKNAFKNCSSLKRISVPKGIPIDEGAFYGCKNLEEFNLDDTDTTVTTIAKDVFKGCTSLKLTAKNVTSAVDADTLTAELEEFIAPKLGILKFSNETDVKTKFPEFVTNDTYSQGLNITTLFATPEQIVSRESPTKISRLMVTGNVKNLTILKGESDVVFDDDFKECYAVGGQSYSKIAKWTNVENLTIQEGFTEIGSSAFSNNMDNVGTKLTNVKIPESIKKIGNGAFFGSCKLTQITIPESVEEIGRSAFAKSGLTKFEIPKNVTNIEDATFQNCTSLTEFKIPSNVKTLGDNAFSGSGLTTLVIEEGLETIGKMAFYNSHLASVNIPASVKSIGSQAFTDSLVNNISVASGNTAYFAENGVLFNKDKTELIFYPPKKADTSYAIPDTVKTIGAYSFYKATTLTQLTIPNGVETINAAAFSWCKITQITIPASVETISTVGEGADARPFYGWENTQTINVSWTKGNKPAGWDSLWADGCNANILGSDGASIK